MKQRMILMYITNNSDVALMAEKAGVDWIFIDLEIIGKEARQGHLDTVISKHKISDISLLKNVLTKSKLLVRINPIHDYSANEINDVISSGADIIMLPYFKTKEEVEKFINYVDNRVNTCLLLETPEAVEALDDILSIEGIDYLHIGLNDLHLGYKLDFMFELLSNGTVEKIISKLKETNITYGFGGMGSIGKGMLPAELILHEHYRLNSKMVILSRTFLVDKDIYKATSKEFKFEVNKIRELESALSTKKKQYFKLKQLEVIDRVSKIKTRYLKGEKQ